MPVRSAGLLMFRHKPPGLQVLLVHPGGPYWAKKDLGAWSIPKGEYLEAEDALTAARREFAEETGFVADGPFLPLGTIKQPSGKLITVWACQGDCDPAALLSNSFEMEWPPKSGQRVSFPEIDRAEWFDIDEAKKRILKGQFKFIDVLATQVTTS